MVFETYARIMKSESKIKMRKFLRVNQSDSGLKYCAGSTSYVQDFRLLVDTKNSFEEIMPCSQKIFVPQRVDNHYHQSMLPLNLSQLDRLFSVDENYRAVACPIGRVGEHND